MTEPKEELKPCPFCGGEALSFAKKCGPAQLEHLEVKP